MAYALLQPLLRMIACYFISLRAESFCSSFRVLRNDPGHLQNGFRMGQAYDAVYAQMRTKVMGHLGLARTAKESALLYNTGLTTLNC